MELSNSNTAVTPHQHGTFWLDEGRGKWSISRIHITSIAADLGFCLFRGELHLIIGKFIEKCDERKFNDVLRAYIEDVNGIAFTEVRNALESFLQKNGKFTISSLPMLQENMFLSDNEVNCFKFFKNCFLHITAKEITQYDYNQIPEGKYVLYSKVQHRDYKPSTTGKYLEFLQKATDWEGHSENIKTIIGYLSHEFKDETTGFIVVLTEQCPDPKDGGGSGKNLFCNLLSNTTTYCSKNGKQIKFDEKFFQSWSGQRIMGISDVPKNFDFEFLKEPSTGTFILKKLFKDEVEIPVSEGPKFVVQTNFSYEISDGGLKRRIMPIEFTDYFTKAGGVDVHFGCHFPKGWDDNDWNNFDTTVIISIQTWLKGGRKIKAAELTEGGWEKQFEHTHGNNITDFIREHFNEWVRKELIPSADMQAALKTFYIENDVDKKYHKSSKKTSEAIKEWCSRHKVECLTNQQREVDNMPGISGKVNKKCYVFTRI